MKSLGPEIASQMFDVLQEYTSLRYAAVERQVGIAVVAAVADEIALERQRFEQIDKLGLDTPAGDALLGLGLTPSSIERACIDVELAFDERASALFGTVGDYRLGTVDGDCFTLQLKLADTFPPVQNTLLAQLTIKGLLGVHKKHYANFQPSLALTPTDEDMATVIKAIGRIEEVNRQIADNTTPPMET